MNLFIISLFVIFMTTQVFSEQEKEEEEEEEDVSDDHWTEEDYKFIIPEADKSCKHTRNLHDINYAPTSGVIKQELVDKAWSGEISDDEDLVKYLRCYYIQTDLLEGINGAQIKEGFQVYLNVVMEGKSQQEIDEAMSDCKKLSYHVEDYVKELTKCVADHGGNVKKLLQ